MISPEEAARHTLFRYWDGALPVNPTKIIYAMGGKVIFNKNIEKGMFSMYKGQPVFHINPFLSWHVQRFTLFHLLGHYVLNHGLQVEKEKTRNSGGITCD